MDRSIQNKQKRNLIAQLMQKEFEKNVTKLLLTESNFEKMDQKLDPMIRQYFNDLGMLFQFYEASEEDFAIPEQIDDELIRQQKCSLLKKMTKMIFENQMQLALRKNAELKDLDHIIDAGLSEYDESLSLLNVYYGFKAGEE